MALGLCGGKSAAHETWKAGHTPDVFMASSEEESEKMIPWVSQMLLAAFHRVQQERNELREELTSLQAEWRGF